MKRRSKIAMGLLMAVMAVTACNASTVKAEKSNPGTATIITSDKELDGVESTDQIRGGTNQEDAVLLPMNTKLYGTTSKGQGLWYAFQTNDDNDAAYYITAVNKSVGTCCLTMYIYDELGEHLATKRAYSDGIAVTLNLDELTPSSSYYMKVQATTNIDVIKSDTIHYMLTINNTNEASNAYNTTGSLSEARGTANALEGTINPGTNQDDAAFIPTDVKLSGTIGDYLASWFAFTTGSVQDAYNFSTVNKTPGSNYLTMYLYNEYGTWLATHRAASDGKIATLTMDDLDPNTNYYIRILASTNIDLVTGDTIDYTLSIKAPEEPEAKTATIEELDGEPLVFETPFELTETQVMFVANKALFVDESAAKTALQPVADIILAHPDNIILLAGTTATDGTQEDCVDLSNRRAAAVKNVLVDSFGVPEDQLLTVGLGYEADPFVRGQDRDSNNNFVETEGAKNRRVIVLDANDPIAQELLA